jgi:hypothetical protein
MRNKLLLLFFKVGLMFLCVSSINAQTITENQFTMEQIGLQ